MIPRFRHVRLLVHAVAGLGLSCQACAATGKHPDFTQGDRIPQSATHDWNLGPTGARGWMVSDQMETSDARQIYITKVDQESPAEGVLESGDVILGVARSRFSYDPRTEMGKAVSNAEARDGWLPILRWRNGETAEVFVRLPVLGAYSATAPFDCPKSSQIFERGCEALAHNMTRRAGKGNPIERSLNALALLASGDRKYLPLVRQQVDRAAKYSDPQRRDLHSWW